MATGDEDSGGWTKKVWQFDDKLDTTEREWVPMEIEFYPLFTNFKIQFGVNTKDKNFFVAIDDIELNVGSCKPEVPSDKLIKAEDLSCNFDKQSMCKWREISEPLHGGEWRISASNDFLVNPWLPKFDHTTQGYDGYYLYVDRRSEQSATAILTTVIEENDLPPSRYCFSLWYTLSGRTKNSNLKVIFEQSDRHRFFSLKPTLGWTYFETEFDKLPDVGTNITLRAIVGPEEAIAVDDIEFHAGTCDSHSRKIVYHCNFEHQDICRISVDERPDSTTPYWQRSAIGSEDHTRLVEGDGHAMQLNVVKLAKLGSSRFFTPAVNPREPSCVSFWYKIQDEEQFGSVGSLTVKLVKGLQVTDDVARETVLFSDAIDNWAMNEKSWRPARFDVDHIGWWRLEFEMSWEAPHESWTTPHYSAIFKASFNVTVDDIEVVRGECPPITACNFNDDTCLWQNIK